MRGKSASKRSIVLSRADDELKDVILQLNDRLAVLEKNHGADMADDRQLITRIANLELQVSRLKRFGVGN